MTLVLEKGPSFLLACRAVCPTPGAKQVSGPSKGKATLAHGLWCPLVGSCILWGWEDTVLLLSIIFQEA